MTWYWEWIETVLQQLIANKVLANGNHNCSNCCGRRSIFVSLSKMSLWVTAHANIESSKQGDWKGDRHTCNHNLWCCAAAVSCSHQLRGRTGRKSWCPGLCRQFQRLGSRLGTRPLPTLSGAIIDKKRNHREREKGFQMLLITGWNHLTDRKLTQRGLKPLPSSVLASSCSTTPLGFYCLGRVHNGFLFFRFTRK